MDTFDKLNIKMIFIIFFVIVVGIFIFSCVINYGEDDFWPAVIVETVMESIILGIGFLLAKDLF